MDSVEVGSRRCSRYIILGFSLGTSYEHQTDFPPYVVCSTGYKKARIVSLNLPNKESDQPPHVGQWRPCIEVQSNNLTAARHVLSAFEALFTQLFHDRIEDLSLQLLPANTIRDRTILRQTLVQAIKARSHRRRDSFLERTLQSQLGSFHMVPDILTAFLFFQLPTIFRSNGLFEACTFFQAACSDFVFTGDTIGEVLRKRNMSVEHERDRIKLENVILSSFRVIEALVGEPGKNEKRFKRRLASRGMNFDELVGFPGTRRRTLGDAMYSLNELRDATSAHGIRRRRQPVTWLEAMQAQHLAESVIHQAVWTECCRRGRPEGSDEELKYLLENMYPICKQTGWLARSFNVLGNMTPIEACRYPNGPTIVNDLATQLSSQCSPNLDRASRAGKSLSPGALASSDK